MVARLHQVQVMPPFVCGIDTEMPQNTLKGHTHWVLCVAWSPDARKIASGGKDNLVKVWWGDSGQKVSKPLKGHKKWVTGLAWEPFHVYVFFSFD
jgi:ribosome assembly protein 4